MSKIIKVKKDIHEALKGKIVGFRHNNIKIGDKGVRVMAKPVKKASRGENDVAVYFHLCERNRGGQYANPNDYLDLGHWVKSYNGTAWDFNGVKEDYNPNYYGDLPTPAPVPSFPVTPPYALSVPVETSLMEIILSLDEAVHPSISPLSYISDVRTTGDTEPLGIPDWLEGLRFHGSDVNDPYWEFVDHGEYTWHYDENNNLVGGNWTGSSWMYFIGAPALPDPTYNTDHGSPYPGLRLDEFTAEMLYGEDVSVDNHGKFALSYEAMSFDFDARSETIGGELVHTLTRKTK
jgi:hypothetical protein